MTQPIANPFKILVDTREQFPYTFDGITADAKQKYAPLAITTDWHTLKTGDYSIAGFENDVCVERKSLEDLYSTLGQRREQFKAEHERMAMMQVFGGACCVVIEADWPTILYSPPEFSRLVPKVVFRTYLAWQQRYRIPWIAVTDRRMAEITAFRFLERFWRDREAEAKQARRRAKRPLLKEGKS